MNWNILTDYETMMKNKQELKSKYAGREDFIPVKIAILAGSTVGILKEFLEIFLYQYGIKAEFLEGDYNRVYEEAVFPNLELEQFKPDFVYIHVNNYNLKFDLKTDSGVDGKFNRFEEVWKSLREKYNCYVIQNNFEYYPYRIIGNASRYLENELVYSVDEINRKISDYARNNSWLLLNDLNYLSAMTGLEHWYNDRFWMLYKYPFDLTVQPKVASNLAALIKSVLGKNKKTVITDLDNTLWKGIIGEDGVDKIQIGNETAHGEQFLKIQNYLWNLRQYGIILNISSKNDYETGLAGLNKEESILKPEHFIAKKINWEDKWQNIKELLSEINLGSEAAVFLDDSIVECDSVKSFLPEISVIQAKDSQYLISQLEESHFFEILHYAEEDKQRQTYYQQNQKRQDEQKKFADYHMYLKSLQMKCKMSHLNEGNMDRVVQLSNKTNQFNLTNWRLTQQDVSNIYNDDSYITILGKLIDKYGDNGIVSIIIAKQENDCAHILLWVMSCRVFKRGLEFAMWNELRKECVNRGIHSIYGYYHMSQKNSKVKDFYEMLEFSKIKSDSEGNDEWKLEDIEKRKDSTTFINIEEG